MNARFGCGLSPNLADRTTLAILHAIVDPAAAGIIAAGGLMFPLGQEAAGCRRL